MSIIESIRQNDLLFIGLITFVISFLAAKPIMGLFERQTVADRKIRGTVNIAMLVGLALIVIGILPQTGNGLGEGDNVGVDLNSQGNPTAEAQPDELVSFSLRDDTARSDEENIEAILVEVENRGRVDIRVYGAQVFFFDLRCESKDELSYFISQISRDDIQIRLIDDYAEDAVFKEIESVLRSLGISTYQIKESTKG